MVKLTQRMLRSSFPLMTLAIVLASDLNARALEGLKLSVQGCNVVLCWPSLPGQSYIVQYRPTLDPGTPWQTLTNAYPANWITNRTVFVHSNAVQYPKGGSGSLAVKSLTPATAASLTASASVSDVAKVMPADGTGAAVPMAIYPPGFDFSGYVLFTPAISGKAGEIGLTPTGMTPLSGGPVIPKGGGTSGGGNDATPVPVPGFYQVVQDGVKIADSSLAMLTHGLLSNTVTIKFEAGNADPNNGTNLIGTLSSAVLFVDGVKFAGEGGNISVPTSPWQFNMDTAYLENGDHWLQVQVFWYDPDSANDGTETMYPSRYSDSVMITVSNAISYPYWEEDIGEAATNAAYFLQTTCTNADWSIAIYDVHSNLVQTLTGHTTDGMIEAYWNMVDKNGVARTNADVDPEFGSIVTVADPITKKTPKKKPTKNNWPEHGVWTVAYLDYFKHFYDPNHDMQGHINQFTLTAGKYGGYWIYYPQPGQTNDIGQTYPMRYWNPKYTNEIVTWGQIAKDSAMLKSMLSNTNSRNFFYRGHGWDGGIGYTSVSELAQVIKHRYRFVLLQSCHSADGQLDHAFGIKGPEQFDLPYYQKTGIRPAAFMGNHGLSFFADGEKKTVNGVDYEGSIPWQIPYLYYNFLFYWDADLMGWDLFYAMGQAMYDLPPIDKWSSDRQPGMALRIYGYPFLHIDEFNYRTDWP